MGFWKWVFKAHFADRPFQKANGNLVYRHTGVEKISKSTLLTNLYSRDQPHPKTIFRNWKLVVQVIHAIECNNVEKRTILVHYSDIIPFSVVYWDSNLLALLFFWKITPISDSDVFELKCSSHYSTRLLSPFLKKSPAMTMTEFPFQFCLI